MNYYICKMKDGSEVNFGRQGVVISWDAGMFKVMNPAELVIAVVPVENVSYFMIREVDVQPAANPVSKPVQRSKIPVSSK